MQLDKVKSLLCKKSRIKLLLCLIALTARCYTAFGIFIFPRTSDSRILFDRTKGISAGCKLFRIRLSFGIGQWWFCQCHWCPSGAFFCRKHSTSVRRSLYFVTFSSFFLFSSAFSRYYHVHYSVLEMICSFNKSNKSAVWCTYIPL